MAKLTNFALFSFSNGFLLAMCSIKAPKVVKGGEAKGNVGAFTGVAKITGILIGSLLAIPAKEIIKMANEDNSIS